MLKRPALKRGMNYQENNDMRILGIESSCDETAAAVLEFEDTKIQRYEDTKGVPVRILSNIVHSQIATHRKTGGIVPEVAAREHVQKIIPVVEEALKSVRHPGHDQDPDSGQARMTDRPPVDAIAVTYGPGLITSLLVGVETARTLSWAWNVPVVAVNHMEGHISAAFLQPRNDPSFAKASEGRQYLISNIQYPALALVVSGGHTELVLIKKPLYYHIIGATRDDAVGEAFDKVAKILGLEYPGGPVVSKLAESGDPEVFPFSAPMIKSPDYDFSFSGIKTAVLYKVRDITSSSLRAKRSNPRSDSGQARMTTSQRNDICAGFQKAAVDVLVAKTIRAVKEYKIKTVMLAGGVAANKQLRTQLGDALNSQILNTKYVIPELQFCTDNAVMIATAGYFHALKKQFTPWKKLDVDPNVVLGV